MNKSDLHAYQLASANHIIAHRYCGLFLEMGLGKTVSTLTAIDALIYDYCEISRILVIAPKRVAETVWQEEAKKWEHLQHLVFSKIIGSPAERVAALQKKAQIYIISRDNIAWLCSQYGPALRFDMVVIDELSSFKSYKAQRFKALKLARPFLKRVVGLTGTPAPNGLIDLWPQMWLIDMGDRLEKSITRYRETYFTPGPSNGHIVFKYIPKQGAQAIILKKLEDICMSLKSSDYLTMPLCTYNFIDLYLPEKLQKQYDEFEREQMLSLLDSVGDTQNITAVNAASLNNKLLQFANGALYNGTGDDRAVYQIHSIKLEALRELVELNEDKSILVAWTFQFDRNNILNYLKDYKPRELKTAQDINDWNAGKIQVALAHPASAGHGLNLQAGGNIIVWYGLTWSLELYQQFNARLYRQGQQNHVIIHHLVMHNTPDEDVIKAIRLKERTQEALMEGLKRRIAQYSSLWNQRIVNKS